MTDGAGVVWNLIGAPKKGDGFKDLEYFHPQNKGQVKIPIFKGSIPKPARQASNFSKAAFFQQHLPSKFASIALIIPT